MKTDARLQQDVMAALNWEPAVNASRIGVNVKEGIVTLAGHVSSYAEKWCAEHAAQSVSGVKSMTTRMDVNLPGASRRSDADIARSAESLLRWTTYLPKQPVKVTVESGWITLTGEMEWEFQRQSAAGAVRYLMGVTGFSNLIDVKPRTPPGTPNPAGVSASQPRAVAVAPGLHRALGEMTADC